MSEDKRYNGWTNYETWCWKLWMDNEQGSFELWAENAEQCWKDSDSDLDDAAKQLADMLKEDAEENNPLPDNGPYCDLMSAALGEIDWYEIAESLLDDVDKDEAEEA